jgi:hypothetical protein
MKIRSFAVAACAVSALALAGCASMKTAQPKSVTVSGQKLDFGGTYDPRAKDLTITINNDPVLRGKFPPFTPTQKLNGKYKDLDVFADCYFGSVLGDSGGVAGIVAGAIQGAKGKAADKCEMSINGKVVESLFF